LPIKAKFDIRLYSVLVFILLGFSIILEFISNLFILTQWDFDAYHSKFDFIGNQLPLNIGSNKVIDFIFYFDLILQHFIAFILLIGKVCNLLVYLRNFFTLNSFRYKSFQTFLWIDKWFLL
jgi:hypothetical protein